MDGSDKGQRRFLLALAVAGLLFIIMENLVSCALGLVCGLGAGPGVGISRVWSW